MTKRACSILALTAAALLAGCGSGEGSAVAAEGAGDALVLENAAATAQAEAVQAVAADGVQPVRVGIDGEHGMDACHTNGSISAQDSVPILTAPNETAAQADLVEPGLMVNLCETLPGWRGVVYQGEGDAELHCGMGENLPGPRDYTGPCRSGWVPENNIEVTAG